MRFQTKGDTNTNCVKGIEESHEHVEKFFLNLQIR